MSSFHNHRLPRLDQLTLSSDKNDDVQAKIFNGPFVLDDSDDDEGGFDEIGDTTGVKRVRSPTIASGTKKQFVQQESLPVLGCLFGVQTLNSEFELRSRSLISEVVV